jgi:AcrR family transcriptional regulator
MPPASKRSDGPAGSRTGRRRGPSKGDLKEAAILDCAWALLAHKPVADITIEELARGAGISRPTFYFYFESREAVIRALAANVADQLLATASGVTEPTDDSPEVVTRQVVAAYMERWQREGPVLRAMAPLYESDPEHRRFWDGINDQIVDAIATTIAAERAAGRALPGPPAERDLARALMAMLWRSGYELSLERRSAAALRRRIDTLTAVSLRAIYGA